MRCRPCGAPRNEGAKCVYCQCLYSPAGEPRFDYGRMSAAEHQAALMRNQVSLYWDTSRQQMVECRPGEVIEFHRHAVQITGANPVMGGLLTGIFG